MPDIASTDVAYTPQSEGGRVVHRISAREKRVYVQLVFGDGALTYPTGGVPLSAIASDVDMIRAIRRWELVDSSDATGIVWKYDHTNKKLRGYQSPAVTHGHDMLIIGGEAAATTNVAAHYATDILGKEAAANATIAKADVATKGGVVGETLAVGDLTELAGGVATPAAQTLFMFAYGW